MGHTVTQHSWPQGEAKQAGDRPADAEAEANKQRRKVQNRKNQRAHRLRLKDRDGRTAQKSRPFKVRRWRLDEPDDCFPQETSLASESATTTHISPQPPRTYTGISPSTAELSNKRTLNTLPSDPTTCPVTGPYRDDTTLYPLNPDIPPSLVPTTLQQTRYHSIWINVIPFPRVRDNLIRCEGRYDPWELMQDLVGEFMSSTPAPWRRATPILATVPETRRTLTLSSGSDTDEVTAGRKGLIVWGEPHEIQSWEATPGFLAKWTWAVEGCEELIEISNNWRMKRGEEPMRLSVSRSYPPP